MARVTVEDCITKVDNRFELVMLAANRARAISSGAPLTVDRDNDKNPVVSLREIAEETIGVDEARENLIRGLQQRHEFEEFGEDEDVIVAEGGDDDGPIVLEAPEMASSEPSAFAETPPSEVIGE